MPRDNTISWSQSEEENLLPWLSRHRALSWKARSNAYFKQYRRRRSGESLRGKQNQILRKLGQVRRRTLHLQTTTARRAQTRHQTTRFEVPTPRPSHVAGGPAVDQIVEPTRQLQITSHSHPTCSLYFSTQRLGYGSQMLQLRRYEQPLLTPWLWRIVHRRVSAAHTIMKYGNR